MIRCRYLVRVSAKGLVKKCSCSIQSLLVARNSICHSDMKSVSWVMNDLQTLAASLPAARLALGKGSFQRTMSSVREKIVLRESGSDWQKIRRDTAEQEPD